MAETVLEVFGVGVYRLKISILHFVKIAIKKFTKEYDKMKKIISLLNSMAIAPSFDEFGKLSSVVINHEDYQTIPEATYKILDKQLRKMGSSMAGAKDAAAFLLESTSMFPIAIQYSSEFQVWFPSESPRNYETCIYFAVHQILDFEAYSDTETIVHGYGKHNLVVPVPYSKFYKRYRKALILLAYIYLNQQNFKVQICDSKKVQLDLSDFSK